MARGIFTPHDARTAVQQGAGAASQDDTMRERDAFSFFYIVSPFSIVSDRFHP
jgi:hypothetical protein